MVAVAAGLCLGLSLAGCGWRRPGRVLRPASAADLLETLAARRSAVTSLRARVRLRAGLPAAFSRQALLVRRPDRVRIDVFSPVGLAYALGTEGGLLWAYPLGEATRYEGPATPANVGRLLGAPVAPADVVDILLGVPPARTAAGPPELTATRDGEYRLTVPLGDGAQTIWFAGDTFAVRRAEEVRDGVTTLRVAFDDYRDGFPHALDVEGPAGGTAARLVYARVEPNVPVDPALFAPPPAARVLPLEAATVP